MRADILKSLSYFDVFNHPLKGVEIANLCGLDINNSSLQNEFDLLVSDSICYTYNNYYSLSSEISRLVEEREHKEYMAEAYFKKLPFYTKLIKSFPFVRAISISGSLSKNVMHENGDIDYFIITKKGRLWICRTILILFKKVFLLNSRKYFCVNYFVDEDNLEILDKNIFTAVEVSHLIPVYNHALIKDMRNKNNWINDYFPGFSSKMPFIPFEGSSVLKRISEAIFAGKLGDRLDLFLMKLTYSRWKKKFSHFNAEKMELTMRSNRGISKHHPSDFQNKVLGAYQERLENLKLTDESTVHA